MRRRAERRRLRPGINLTPMLDILFNLLFFLMLISRLREAPVDMRVRLPEASAASARAEEDRPLAITLDAGGGVFFDNRVVADSELELELAVRARDGLNEVLIRGDRRVDYGRVVAVMDLCKRAGIRSVLLDLERAAEPVEE